MPSHGGPVDGGDRGTSSVGGGPATAWGSAFAWRSRSAAVFHSSGASMTWRTSSPEQKAVRTVMTIARTDSSSFACSGLLEFPVGDLSGRSSLGRLRRDRQT